jgi:hypothetical protein
VFGFPDRFPRRELWLSVTHCKGTSASPRGSACCNGSTASVLAGRACAGSSRSSRRTCVSRGQRTPLTQSSHARMPRTTFPCTSVSRCRRP